MSSNNRGRLYICNTCHFSGEKDKVFKHYYKKHVAIDNVPFYCTICRFITNSSKELMDHIEPRHYPAHAATVEVMVKNGDDVHEYNSLIENKHYYKVTETDVTRASKAESDSHFVNKKRDPAPAESQDTLSRALHESKITFDDDENILPQIMGNGDNAFRDENEITNDVSVDYSNGNSDSDSSSDEESLSSESEDEIEDVRRIQTCCEHCVPHAEENAQLKESVVILGGALEGVIKDIKELQEEMKILKDKESNKRNTEQMRRYVPYAPPKRNIFNKPFVNKHVRF